MNTFCLIYNVSDLEPSYIPLIPKLDRELFSKLLNPLDLIKIKNALWSIGPYKTLGDDGLHAIFYQKNWDSISDKLLNELLTIFSTWTIPSSWCNTLICLIPKINNPYTTNHFRPLGLCTTHYKIVAKILLNRIRSEIQKFISPLQGAFVKGRQSSDLFILAQEVLHSMNASSSKQGSLVLKLDIKKAFDTISWDFITTMLVAYNFPTQWINLINSYLRNMVYTPIINGVKTEPFKHLRGIRQGDPLSPYLFILAMEYLSIMITEAVNTKTWKPFKLNNQDLNISHLLFADDVLFFAKADSCTINTISHIIDTFCNTSGMEINLEKSKLWLSNKIPDNRKLQISNSLRIIATANIGSYLGFPLKPQNNNSDFNYIINNI